MQQKLEKQDLRTLPDREFEKEALTQQAEAMERIADSLERIEISLSYLALKAQKDMGIVT